MMVNIKVSVCIPVYGVEKYIERCARSLFEQTMRDGIEFIFVNDCTPDKSIEILEQVLSEYPHRREQTRIIHHKQNCGLVAARKTGLAHASGEYIIHCDSDDWTDTDLYQTMYDAAIANHADVVYVPHITHCGQSCRKSQLPVCDTPRMLLQKVLDDRLLWSIWSKMFRREIALDHTLICPDNICHSEDLLRNCQMLALCQRSCPADNVFYHYFKGNAGAYTSNFSRKSLDNMLESISILQKKLSGDYDFSTTYTFALFMGIIYKLWDWHEFQRMLKNIRLKQIIRNKNPLPIRLVVYSATLSYSVTAYFCNFLLNLRKKHTVKNGGDK